MTRAVVRRILLEHPDGMTARDIAIAMYDDPYLQNNVTRMLRGMPDCYIDRHTPQRRAGHHAAVWIAVPIPPHCPPPDVRVRLGRPPKVQQAGASV